MYMTQFLHRLVRQAPEERAAQDIRRALSWRELALEVRRFAGALRRDGMQSGERVAIMARNRVEFLVYAMGTFWAGGVIVPVNLRWAAPEIAHALRDCGARFLFIEPAFLALLPDLLAAVPQISGIAFDAEEGNDSAMPYAAWLAGECDVEDTLRRGDDLAAILYTGGTTGRSKGVMLSHANLAWSMFGTIAATDGPATRRHLHVAPLFHVGALSNLLIGLATGATTFFLPLFDPQRVSQAIAEWRVDEVFLVPTMIRAILDQPDFNARDLACIRRVRYGASPIDHSLLERALAALPNAGFVQGYGMTELAPVATILTAADHDPARPGFAQRIASAGRATAACEVRVVEEGGAELPAGAIGEIVVRGPSVMLGYWNLPSETGEAVRNGWLHTGDVGFLDDAGYLTVVDRLKDMIITGGENVYSTEVENVLASHPCVAQAAVVGLPDARWGERVHAVLVARPGEMLDPQDILRHCRPQIAAYKLPKSFAIVEALPLTAAGKPLKAALRSDPAYRGFGASS